MPYSKKKLISKRPEVSFSVWLSVWSVATKILPGSKLKNWENAEKTGRKFSWPFLSIPAALGFWETAHLRIPKPTFRPKWKVSVNVKLGGARGVGGGGWVARQFNVNWSRAKIHQASPFLSVCLVCAFSWHSLLTKRGYIILLLTTSRKVCK